MLTLQQLYQDLDTHNIRLIPYKFNGQKGASMELSGNYAVFLDVMDLYTTAEIAGVLSHEIGHCVTGATHAVHSPFDLVEKHEHTANRWAVERYLPHTALQQAFSQGCTQPWQLAEYFNLPESFIRYALWYHTQCRGRSFTSPAPQPDLSMESI